MAISNAITAENQLPGTPKSVWQLSNGPSQNIEGFATDISYDQGQSVSFKVNTDSTNYRLEIYRLGYYNGDGARLISSLTHLSGSAIRQPIALVDPATGLVDAGNWSITDTWQIPADAVSGVYFAKLIRQDGVAGQNIIPFVVRNDSAPSDITFQTSDTTWQAYNAWGGNSLYTGAVAVSYNRPFSDPTGLYSVFSADYPAISFFEQNGFDVNYIAGVDTARSGSQLLNSKLFVSAGHDEYWSAEQRTNVEAAKANGVNLAFFGGNDVFWKTRWGTSIDGSKTSYRTLITYKTTETGLIDPSGIWTGTWADPNTPGGAHPQNELTGTIFNANGTSVSQYASAAISVPAEMAALRFWRNTALSGLQAGQIGKLAPGSLGYEWDSDLDNGFRPAGLIDLSSTTLTSSSILNDFGSNTYGPGTATHALTLYRDQSSGALVFSAGSIFFAWSLSTAHAGLGLPSVAVDPKAQQAMINLFADMGIQPGSLSNGLVAQSASADHIAPVSIVGPVGALSGGNLISVQGSASDLGGGRVASVEVSTDGGTVWHRANGVGSWSYDFTTTGPQTYEILSRAVDDSLNLQTPKNETLFPVSGGLLSTSATPDFFANDPNSVELGVRFTTSENGLITGLRFFKSPLDTGTHTASLWTSNGLLLGSAVFSNETASGWQTVSFNNPIAIIPGVTYVASYHSNGDFSDSFNYFNTVRSSGVLTTTVGSGVYAYGSSSVFPTQSYLGSNYSVDVAFTPTPVVSSSFFPATAGPDFFANDPNSVELGIKFTASEDGVITALQFYKSPLDTGVHSGSLWTDKGVLLANATFTNETASGWQTVEFANPITVTAGTTYVASYHSNGYFADAFSYFNTQYAAGPLEAPASASVYAYGSTPVFPNQSYNDSNYWIDVKFKAQPAVDNNPGLFPYSATPDFFANDPNSVELGVKFTTSQSGDITALQYYKSPLDTGTHTGSLWTSDGTLLASATYANETASGWQTVNLSTPVPIAAGDTYVASYHSNGYFADSLDYFDAQKTNASLTAPANASVYAYGSASSFPTQSYAASNYWADVVFQPTLAGA